MGLGIGLWGRLRFPRLRGNGGFIGGRCNTRGFLVLHHLALGGLLYWLVIRLCQLLVWLDADEILYTIWLART